MYLKYCLYFVLWEFDQRLAPLRCILVDIIDVQVRVLTQLAMRV